MSYLREMMVAVLLTTSLMVGCGGGGGGSQQDWVLGNWEAYATSVSLNAERIGVDQVGVRIHFHFNAGGTWSGDLYIPGQADYDCSGTWVPRSDGYLLVDDWDQSETRFFRQGVQMYWVEMMVDEQLLWFWLRRT